MPPGHAPKRPQIDPSRSQEAIFSLLNFDLVLRSIFDRFWLPFGFSFGHFWVQDRSWKPLGVENVDFHEIV